MEEIIEKILKRYKKAIELAAYFKLKTDKAVEENADDDVEMYSEMAGAQIDIAYAFYELLAHDLNVKYTRIFKAKCEAEKIGQNKYYTEA